MSKTNTILLFPNKLLISSSLSLCTTCLKKKCLDWDAGRSGYSLKNAVKSDVQAICRHYWSKQAGRTFRPNV